MTQISQQDLSALNAKFATSTPLEVLQYAVKQQFIDNIALVSSYGAEAVILLHLVSQVDANLPVIFIDTGKLFGETKRYRDKVNQLLNLTNIISFKGDEDEIKAADPKGILWAKDTTACCLVRKVLPYARATEPYAALITGRKRFQGNSRSQLDIFELANGQVKINPLANWGLDELKNYILDNDLPRHPLVADGYLSIGCMPCTDKVETDGEYRDGRWQGQEKTECGIHML
ncbi:MAG: phosphoadenylyl-sulfate reductase [Rhizobiales bacterium]|nr:phosphoadenylyl-sulfate reductase [Hyphomicrobiales bacterium]NRB13785.1 phosphoadenylyl-sulfate reductase [Hyphomicrobiales bacterium]